MIKNSFFILLLASNLFAHILISAGGFDVQKYQSHYSFKDSHPHQTDAFLTEVLKKYSPNTNAVSMWITPQWNENWYSAKTIQSQIIDKGYTPVFIFYYFADNISQKYIQNNNMNYFIHLKRFTRFLKKLDGKKIVILNPEYNENNVGKWQGMNQIFLKSYSILRQDKDILVGPCVGDFGNYLKTNEPKEWKLFDKSIKEAAKKADFIAFQEMRALTRNTKQEIRNTPKRAYYLSKYLYKKYHKPTLLAYLAVSSYGKGGTTLQKNVYKEFVNILPKMVKDSHLMLFGIFHYFDYPGHVGYFKKAEEYFGVLKKDGTKKPSFKYYNQLGSNLK